MKQLILLMFAAALLTACCKEDQPAPPYDMDVPGLPTVTQSGRNTLGFLLNGQPWVPAGPNNMSVDYDPGFKNGVVGIIAYRRVNLNDNSSFSFGIGDSLNSMLFPKTLAAKKGSLAQFNFSDENFCIRAHYDTTVYRNGFVTVSQLDRTRRIIAGTFEVILFNPLCGDTIRITKGRFDLSW